MNLRPPQGSAMAPTCGEGASAYAFRLRQAYAETGRPPMAKRLPSTKLHTHLNNRLPLLLPIRTIPKKKFCPIFGVNLRILPISGACRPHLPPRPADASSKLWLGKPAEGASMNLRPPRAQQRLPPAASLATPPYPLPGLLSPHVTLRRSLPTTPPPLFRPIKFPPCLSSCPQFFIQLLQNGKLIPKFGSIRFPNFGNWEIFVP